MDENVTRKIRRKRRNAWNGVSWADKMR